MLKCWNELFIERLKVKNGIRQNTYDRNTDR